MLRVLDTSVRGKRRIVCEGQLDYATQGEMSRVLAQLGNEPEVEFDLSRVTFVDSTGLSGFMPGLDELISRGTRVTVFVNREVFEILQLIESIDPSDPRLSIRVVN